MDADVEKMHLQSIEEYVLDEEKIVTYHWLSKVLSVHVNFSKELLSKFASDPSHENNVYLTYLISGKLKDGSYSVLVVGQDKFEEAKLNFEFITSHHVYSVQKKKETPSANYLYMVNSEKVENEMDVLKQIRVIKCALSVQRAKDEMSDLRLKSLLINAPTETVASVKKAASSADIQKKVEEREGKETTVSKSSEDKKTPENKPKAAGGLAAMFAAQSSKSSSAASASSKTKAKPPVKKSGGINSFFSKVPKTESPPKDEAQKESSDNQQTDEPMDVDVSTKETDKGQSVVEDSKLKVEKISPPKTDKPREQKASPPKTEQGGATSKSNGKPKNKAKRKSKPKLSSKPAKTRKRIKVIDSDSSDDMFASEKEDSPEPIDRNSPPPPVKKIEDSDDEVIPPTPQPESDKKNHRHRKIVKDNSYLDEEGFIVTEKITVYESCSDSEPENKDTVKKPKAEESAKSTKTESTSKAIREDKSKNNKDTKKPAKKPVSPVKNKQSSLMNFFKKV